MLFFLGDNMIKSIKSLTKFEIILWLVSVIVVTVSFVVAPDNVLTYIASLIGVTALIFVAKGFVLGQILSVVFAVFYGIISFHFKYYGEMITYVFMTAPMSIMSMISWIKNPYKDTLEVTVNKINKKQVLILLILSIIVTIVFYFILKALNTANLIFSTISITTSFIAVSLSFLRSPYYALGYATNDIVLIILWSLASIQDISYIPMIMCFVMFLVNDLYGLINWKKMQKKQKNS